jgi:proteic killer suppression protein
VWNLGTSEPCPQGLNSVSCGFTVNFMIVSFKHRGLEQLYRLGSTKGVQSGHVPKLLRALDLLEIASSPRDLSIPEFRIHPLQGNRKGFYSIWISENWRLTFRFSNGDVEKIDYEDYH